MKFGTNGIRFPLFQLAGVALLAISLLKEPVHPALLGRPVWSAVAILAGLAIAWLPPFRAAREAVARMVFETGELRFRWMLFGAGWLTAGGAACFIFGRVPHLDDGVAALFQARILASGRVVLPLPEHPDFFACFGVLSEQVGHW